MYDKLDPSMNFAEREEKTVEFWKENKVFEKSTELRKGKEEFSFYDGPPTANGKPHVGHILTRSIKDVIPRFWTMKGKFVRRQAGWDTHGLPVELEVEKSLGFSGKEDIEKYGVEPFIKACKESVFKYQSAWERMSDRVGYWVDMEHPYVTYHDDYIESVWWALSEIYKKGLIYKGHKVVPFCPRCGTALSSHEVSQGYKDVEEVSCVVKFKVPSLKNTSILAWTTTPWTLPSNAAVCMHPDYDYATVSSGGEDYILAAALVEQHFKDKEYKITGVKKGKEYERLAYEPLFNFYDGKQKAHYVTLDNFVTLLDGTGVVHIAPSYGEDDAKVGRKYGLPFIQMVKEDGKFVSVAGNLAGIFCKTADKLILADLKERGALFSKIPFKHSYPFCWRCDTPLIYYARSSWFIEMTAVKERLIKNNRSVNWMPETIRDGRMGNFLESVMDWGISRERYWGTPLPFWVCPDCGKVKAVGSKEELKKESGQDCVPELHKPYVDNVKLKCECGGEMTRTAEVLDCWFDSGAMPFAQLHYPFENKDEFKKIFPADFISEAVDQTRGWFYTLLAISTLLFDKAPFKNCVVLGHVNDKDGRKMSKRLGNVVDPFSVLDKEGADAVRWYFYTASAPHLPSRFYPEAVAEAQRRFLGTLWNVCSFYGLYAKIDNFDPSLYDIKNCKLSEIDNWILSELNSLTEFVDLSLTEYKITEAARKIEEFTDGLSNWFIRRSRERYWVSGMPDDKIAAFMTLYTALETLSKITAPFTPFIAEEIYQNIVRPFKKDAPISVHLEDFPKADKKRINKSLENEMRIVLTAANLGRAARNAANIKNRQPLKVAYLAGSLSDVLSEQSKAVLADELNVKKIEKADGIDGFISYEVKPQLKTLGPKYGKLINEIRAHLSMNGEKIVASLEKSGKYTFSAGGEKIPLTKDDVLVSAKAKEGFSSESGDALTVILDIHLNEELLEEGAIRELISKIQNLRKETGFSVTDRIKVYLSGDEGICLAAKKNLEKIKSVTLATDILFTENAGETTDINGRTVKLFVSKI